MWLAGAVVGIVASWVWSNPFPGSLAPDERLLRPTASDFALADSDLFTGRPHVFLNATRVVRRVRVDRGCDRLVLLQRADNALTGEDESAIRGLLDLYGKGRLTGLLRHPSRQVGGIASSGRAHLVCVEVGVCLASGDPAGDHRKHGRRPSTRTVAVPDLRLGDLRRMGASSQVRHIAKRA